MTQIWLIRHGEPAESVRGRCYGWLDVSLSEAGREQMRGVAEHSDLGQLDAIFTSTLPRAVESAHIVASKQRCKVKSLDDFNEMHFGDIEGLRYSEISLRFPELYGQWMRQPTNVRFPNGECFADMKARVLKAFEAILGQYENRTVAIVSHAGVNRILIAWALGVPDENIFRLGQHYGCLNLLTLVAGTPILHSLNHRPS